MKNFSYLNILFACVILSFGLSGCKKFLDVKPKGQDIPEKIEHFDGMFNNINLTSFTYTQVSSLGTKLLENTLYNTFMSDELTSTAAATGFMNYMMKQAYSWQGDIFSEEDNACEWATTYSQIYTYNVITDGVLGAIGGTTEYKQQILAEARVSRALRYLILAQYFGKPFNKETANTDLCVPLVTHADLNIETLPRNTVAEVYDFIIKELEESSPLLKKGTYHPLRISQCAGYYFLGKAYWYKGEYDKALTALNLAMDASKNNSIGLTLYDYNTMITQWGYIASKPYAWTTGFPVNNNGSNKEVIYNYQFIVSALASKADPAFFVKPEFMSLYSDNDHRKKFFSDKNTTGTSVGGIRRLPVRTTFNLGAEMSDLYLMRTECEARSSDLAIQETARQHLKEFRGLRMPAGEAVLPEKAKTDQTGLVRFVVEERIREYMMTGLRWFDMRRLWNDPLFQQDKANYTHTDGTKTYTLTSERLTYKIPPKVKVYHTDWENN